jgi:hypothetical protein
MNKELTKEQVSMMLDEKIESLHIRLSISFKQEIQHAIESLRGFGSGETIEGSQYLKSHAVCSLLDISERTLYNKRKSNEIPFVFKNGTYYYKADDITSYMDQGYISSLKGDSLSKKKPSTFRRLAGLL